MHTTKKLGYYLGFAATACMASQGALAQNARTMADMVGETTLEGETKLASRGFTFITSDYGGNSVDHSYWWNHNAKNCVYVKTHHGRISGVSDASKSDCHQKGGGNDVGTALAVAAGAAILGGILSHKKHHHKDSTHYDDHGSERDYDRGYNDGLHNVAYHNYDRSNAYSDGYASGVEQRRHNTSYHHRRGGYTSAAYFQDVRGMDGRAGRQTLESRGFRRVDRIETSSSKYSVFWRPQSRQCLQMTVVDRRVYDIQDVGSDPNCR